MYHLVNLLRYPLIIYLIQLASLFHSLVADLKEEDKISPLFNDLYKEANYEFSQENYEKALDIYLQLLKLNKSFMDANQDRMTLSLQLAKCFYHLKRFHEEISLLENLLQQQPKDNMLIQIMALRAKTHVSQGESFAAYQLLKKTESLVPKINWTNEVLHLQKKITEDLNHQYSEMLAQAENLFDSGLYENSLSLYQIVLEAVDNKWFPAVIERESTFIDLKYSLIYRIASIHFFRENYHEAISLLHFLEDSSCQYDLLPHVRDIQSQGNYLLGLCYRHQGLFHKALEKFQTYLHQETSFEKKFFEETLWELGLCYLKQKNFPKAKSLFDSVPYNQKKEDLFCLSRLYSTRASIAEGNIPEALRTLDSLKEIIDKHHPLYFEMAYLKGECYFKIHNFSLAAEAFEEAVPKKNLEIAEWGPDTLYYLGWCYLRSSQDPNLPKTDLITILDKAKKTFEEAIRLFKEERAYFGLAQVYITLIQKFNDQKAAQEVEFLLSDSSRFSHIDHQAQALLLRAEASTSYSIREEFYEQLTDQAFESSKFYAESWYKRGLSDLEQGLLLQKKHQLNPAQSLLEKGIDCFERAFELFEPHDPTKAALCLKYQAESYYHMKTSTSYLLALDTLDMLLSQYYLFSTMKDQDEVFYLQALIFSSLSRDEEEINDSERACAILNHAIATYPHGKFFERCLFFLGGLQYHKKKYQEAENTFLQLVKMRPLSPLAGDALYFVSNCRAFLNKETASIRNLLEQVYEKYPNSRRSLF